MSLSEPLQDPQRRRAIVADCLVVLDQEVSDKSGLAGMAVKAAFAAVKKLKPGILEEVVNGLLPEFVAALEPLLARRPPGTPVEPFLRAHSNEVVQQLLGVTDARAERTSHGVLRSTYERLRPSGEKHVAAALPRIAALVERHAR